MSESPDRSQNIAAGVAAGAGVLAVFAGLATRRAPRWVRVTVVLGFLALASGAGVYAYRYSAQPVTLSVAAGSFDGDAPKLMAAIASKLNTIDAKVRLKVVEKATAAEAAEAFAKGETQLAVVRPDVGDLSSARAVMIVAHSVVLIIVPPGGTATSMDDLKGKTIGVIGGAINQTVTSIIAREYEFEKNKTRFRDVPPTDGCRCLQAKQVQALLVVMPISERYIARIREQFLRGPKGNVALIPIESAGAIANINKAFESYEVPKGTIRGSPAIPDDDLTTLRLPLYLVASKKVSDDVAGALVKAVFDVRRELVAEYPLLSQLAEPDKDKDAFIPIHPGASQYFEGEQKSFFDRYGDQFFYGSMLLGSLTSLLAPAWKFMARHDTEPEVRPLGRLCALMDDLRSAGDEAELVRVEEAIDDILRVQLDKAAPGEIDAGEAAAVSLAIHRLEHMLVRKRGALAAGITAAMPAAQIRQV